MGNAASAVNNFNPLSSSRESSSSMPDIDIPKTKLIENLDITKQLLEKYNKNDVFDLIEFIKTNKQLQKDIGFDMSENSVPIKLITAYQKKFKANLGDKNLEDILKGSQFIEYLGQIQDNEMSKDKERVLSSEILKNSPEEQQKVREIFTSISNMKTKEEYYKYEYLLTQIWILSYLTNMNTSVTEFIDSTLTLVKTNEEQRNNYTRQMLKILLDIMNKEDKLDEENFRFFKNAMTEFETKIATSSKQLQDGLAKSQSQLQKKIPTTPDVVQGQVQATIPTQAQRGGSKKKQTGGFVRDFSRFPQSFYEFS